MLASIPYSPYKSAAANVIDKGIEAEACDVDYVNKRGVAGFFTGSICIYVTDSSAAKNQQASHERIEISRDPGPGKRDNVKPGAG